MADEDLDLRDSIAAALGDTDDGVTQDTTPTRRDVSGAEHGEVVGEATEVGGKPPVEGRDSLGRFVPKAGEKDDNGEVAANLAGRPAQASPGVPQAGPEIAAAPPTPTATPAPQSWGPAVREKWATLPPEVQQHVAQREQQMQRWANETAPMRQTGEQFLQAIQPFQHAITAEGVDPITAVRNLMQIGTTLRFGTPHEKASTVAKMVRAYGIDVNALDGALVGELPQGGGQSQGLDPATIQAMVQQQLAPLYQAAQQRQQAAYQRSSSEARSELEQFAADPKHEFYNDLRGMMADMIEVSERNGVPMSLADAYSRCAMLHPDVSKVMMARQQGVNAQSLTAAARKAKASAVSVRGVAPAGNPNGREPSSIREGIEAAIEAHSGL